MNLYGFVGNGGLNDIDVLGLAVVAVKCCDCNQERKALDEATQALKEAKETLDECHSDLGDRYDALQAAITAFGVAVAVESAAVIDLWKNHMPRPGKNIPRGERKSDLEAAKKAVLAIAAAEAARQRRNLSEKQYEEKKKDCYEKGQDWNASQKAEREAQSALNSCLQECPYELRSTLIK